MTETDQRFFAVDDEGATGRGEAALRDRYTPIGGYKVPRRGDVARVVDWFLPGTLWGHSVRGLVGNPVFALLPVLYLNWLSGARMGMLQTLWLAAFLLGLPHANYTALEVRHFLQRGDGVAEARTTTQLIFFCSYFVFGNLLSIYYLGRGATVVDQRYGVDVHLATLVLALVGSVGATMGLRDVLVADLIARPWWVLKVAISSLCRTRWATVVWLWALAQFAVVEFGRQLGL